MSIISVGVGDNIQSAIDIAGVGDTVSVAAGTYTNQFLSITKSMTLSASGGLARIDASVSPPNGKAAITVGAPGIAVTIAGFAISGVTVPDNNGAAIRYEGGDLTLRDDWFYNNQEGVLGANDPSGNILMDHLEIAFNGDGSGHTHGVYVNQLASFTITNSYIHDTAVGHEIKSRAANNTITNNRIFDNNGSASYSIDLPNGGNASILNNVIQQGSNTQNPAIIAYGEEGLAYASNNVTLSGNTIVNDNPGGYGILNPTSVGPTNFIGNSVWDLANPLGGDVLAIRPVLDLLPISFITTPPPIPPPTKPGKGHGRGKPTR